MIRISAHLNRQLLPASLRHASSAGCRWSTSSCYLLEILDLEEPDAQAMGNVSVLMMEHHYINLSQVRVCYAFNSADCSHVRMRYALCCRVARSKVDKEAKPFADTQLFFCCFICTFRSLCCKFGPDALLPRSSCCNPNEI